MIGIDFQESDFMITVIGHESNGGTYILKINLKESLSLIFGGFLGGKAILLPQGAYLYIGSALKQKGSSSLAYRLVRHASRASTSPHFIQLKLISFFNHQKMSLSDIKAPSKKTLHWNIDFLLEKTEAEIAEIIILRSSKPMENQWAKMLEKEKETEIIKKGLGANDTSGETHLLKLNSSDKWWKELPLRLSKLSDEDFISYSE
jgi:Uri superfamily endonuclease